MIKVFVPYQSEINFNTQTNEIIIVGSVYLVEKLNEMKQSYGHINNWPLLSVTCPDDILINELSSKVKGTFSFIYPHDELCHCRMITTEKVYSAIKQGAWTCQAVGKSTQAGTGCGSCKKDIEALLGQFVTSSNSTISKTKVE